MLLSKRCGSRLNAWSARRRFDDGPIKHPGRRADKAKKPFEPVEICEERRL